MAIAEVTLTCKECGTKYTLRKKCFNRTEANSWESYMDGNDGLCPECYKKQMAEKRETERNIANTESAKKVSERGLCELVGTEKQVAWANTIRESLVSKFTTAPNENVAKVIDFIEHSITSASYWIENRSDFNKIVKYACETLNVKL